MRETQNIFLNQKAKQKPLKMLLVCSFIKVGLEISSALESNRIIINMGTYGTGIWCVISSSFQIFSD